VSIGGNNLILVTTDRKTGFLCGATTPAKNTPKLNSRMTDIVATYASFGHKVRRMTTDDERCLRALKQPLGLMGIELTATPAGMHEKTAERAIQTIKFRKMAMCAALTYELPAELECEAFWQPLS
jgi:hypothetical protein